MVERAGRQSRRKWEGRHQNSLFYVDGGILALSDPVWLQWAFIALVGMFDWVLLRKSIMKTVIMVFCPYHSASTQLEAVYKQRMTGAGLSYRERQRVRVQCSECG